MSTNTTYRSPELASRIGSLRAEAGAFDLDAIDHGVAFLFTECAVVNMPEQAGNAETLKSNLQYESNYALANEDGATADDGVDLPVSARPRRRRLGGARPPAPGASSSSERDGGER
jgi:hypothetical protein